MENYRYYSVVDRNGYFRCNQLVSIEQVSTFVRTFGQDFEQFYTIQRYSIDGSLESCPIYIDIDSSDLYEAYNQTKETVEAIRHLGIELPIHVWFSGSKGFHIILPYIIRGDRCFEYAREIVKEFTNDADMSVYTNRRMWRVHNTVNRKSGMYKIYLGDLSNLTFDKIIEMAKVNEDVLPIELKAYSCEVLKDLLSSIVLPALNMSSNSDYYVTPCIKKLLKESHTEKGNRHQIAYVICRHFYLMDYTKQEAEKHIRELPMYNKYAEKQFKTILKSVYTHGAKGISCKGMDDFLTDYCGKFCPFDKSWNLKDIFRRD
ncbi:MAG: hypothetical protein U9O94_02635 [Nanoarchaeota archaeon]|nr:hypothetical protein [Nanoarchaeota archaeon]